MSYADHFKPPARPNPSPPQTGEALAWTESERMRRLAEMVPTMFHPANDRQAEDSARFLDLVMVAKDDAGWRAAFDHLSEVGARWLIADVPEAVRAQAVAYARAHLDAELWSARLGPGWWP
jgi:hypothetical protein